MGFSAWSSWSSCDGRHNGRVAVYLAITLAGVRLGRHFGGLFPSSRHAHGMQLSVADVTVSFLVALAFVVFTHLDRLLGGRGILDMLLGRQLKPHRQERVFLLADFPTDIDRSPRFLCKDS